MNSFCCSKCDDGRLSPTTKRRPPLQQVPPPLEIVRLCRYCADDLVVRHMCQHGFSDLVWGRLWFLPAKSSGWNRKPCGRASMPLRSISRAMVASLITPFLTDGNRKPSRSNGRAKSMMARASFERGTRKVLSRTEACLHVFGRNRPDYHLQFRLAEETEWVGSEAPSGSTAEEPGA